MKITKQTRKEELEKASSDCKRCGHCCTFGSGWVLDNEIPDLAENLGLTKEEFTKTKLEPTTLFNTTIYRFRQVRKEGMPYGHCVFRSKEMTCEIQDIKPLHCRITSCKTHGVDANEWYIVNNFVNPADPESVKEWKIRLDMKGTIEGGDIESLIPDKEFREMMVKRK
jgi:Fe-S-cluster containining protein